MKKKKKKKNCKKNIQAITCEANLIAEQYEIEEPVWDLQNKNTLKRIHILYVTTQEQFTECSDYITSEFKGSS